MFSAQSIRMPAVTSGYGVGEWASPGWPTLPAAARESDWWVWLPGPPAN